MEWFGRAASNIEEKIFLISYKHHSRVSLHLPVPEFAIPLFYLFVDSVNTYLDLLKATKAYKH